MIRAPGDKHNGLSPGGHPFIKNVFSTPRVGEAPEGVCKTLALRLRKFDTCTRDTKITVLIIGMIIVFSAYSGLLTKKYFLLYPLKFF